MWFVVACDTAPRLLSGAGPRSQVWDLADEAGNGWLDRANFKIAMQLCSLAQVSCPFVLLRCSFLEPPC